MLILLSFVSGLFKDIICLFIVIIVHELGHIITSLICGWDIKKVDISMCGGFITYNENIDKPFIEEFLISISGIVMQIIFYAILTILYNFRIIDLDTIVLFNKYNISIFIFNILPIVPLDGSKIINVLLNIYFPYKKSLKITNYISILTILLLILIFVILKFKIEFSYIIIITFIISKVIQMIKDVPYLFNRFLFERYKKPIIRNKFNYIKDGNINNMKRQVKNYFRINGKYYKENDILRKRFD